MPKYTPDDPRQLFRLLSTPLSEFLNHGKLFTSRRMLEMVRLATSGALNGNFQYATQLISTFDGSPYQSAVVRWFEHRTAAAVILVSAKPVLRKLPKAVPRIVQERDYFPDAVRAFEAYVSQQKIASLEGRGKVVEVSGQVDLMDAGRRLPGSFENGKRR